jgi:hypothetical protein
VFEDWRFVAHVHGDERCGRGGGRGGGGGSSCCIASADLDEMPLEVGRGCLSGPDLELNVTEIRHSKSNSTPSPGSKTQNVDEGP